MSRPLPNLPFSEDLDETKIVHVNAPSGMIFLCGGKTTDLSCQTPISLRDAFLKVVEHPAIKDRDFILAEEITSQSHFGEYYDNLLDFEAHLAQIVELIILFAESEGSLAELGAFALIDEIAQRLFVVLREKDWDEISFIRLGPLKRIEKKFGRKFIFLIEEKDIGVMGKNFSNFDKSNFKRVLHSPLEERIKLPKSKTTFDKENSGHIIKLMVGFVQEYGALTEPEIISLLQIYNVDCENKNIPGLILCAISIRWLVKISKGSHDYLAVKNLSSDAATIPLKTEVKEKDRGRRRFTIREFWKNNDLMRYQAIQKAMGKRSDV